MINKFIQELDTLNSESLTLSDYTPIAAEVSDNQFETFKISMMQLQALLHQKPTAQELLDAIETNPNLTNLIYTVDFDKLIINYDTKDLDLMMDIYDQQILPFIVEVQKAIQRENPNNANDFYILSQEIPAILKAIDELKKEKIKYQNIFLPEQIDPVKPIFTMDNYKPMPSSKTIQIDPSIDVINVYCKYTDSISTITFEKVTNAIRNFREFRFTVFSSISATSDNLFSPKQFFTNNTFSFKDSNNKNVFSVQHGNLMWFEDVPSNIVTFSIFFNNAGFASHTLKPIQNFINQQQLSEFFLIKTLPQEMNSDSDNDAVYFSAKEIATSIYYFGEFLQETKVKNFNVWFVTQDSEINYESFFLRINFALENTGQDCTISITEMSSFNSISASFKAPRGVSLIRVNRSVGGAGLSVVVLAEDQDLSGYPKFQEVAKEITDQIQEFSDNLEETLEERYFEKPEVLAEIQKAVVDAISGGTIDLTEYVTKIFLADSLNPINTKLTNLDGTLNNLIVSLQEYATKDELFVVSENADKNKTDIENLTNNLNANYYDKPTADSKFASISSVNIIETDLDTANDTIDKIKEQYLRKEEANLVYATNVLANSIKEKAQASIPQILDVNELPSYTEIPTSAKKVEITASIQQIRDQYIGYLDLNYEIDEKVTMHLEITVTKTNINLSQNFLPPFQNISYNPLGAKIGEEYFIDFRHNNSKVSNIRPNLKGVIVSNLRYPYAAAEQDETFIFSGTRHITNTSEKTWMHPTRRGLTDKEDLSSFWSSISSNDNFGYIPEQSIGRHNIPKAMNSALMTGQIPINICFALKTHRPIYIEIINPDAPTVNVTCTFMVEKENQFGWIQPNTAYNNSTFLIFTNNISKPIPKELQYIFDEFKIPGYRFQEYDPRAKIDNIELPTLNGQLAFTASVFPDFFASQAQPLKCLFGYFDHPSNLYYYLIVRYGDSIYTTKKSDYLNYSVKYDGRTIDLKDSIKYIGSKTQPENTTLYLSNACKTYDLVGDNLKENLYKNCWKYIIRKDFSTIKKLAGWSENQCFTDANSKGVIALKPNSYILYIEPNSMLPKDVLTVLFDVDVANVGIPNPDPNYDIRYGGNKKIVNLAATFDEISKTKWIAIHMLYRPINKQSQGSYRYLNRKPTVGRILPEITYNSSKWNGVSATNSAIYQGEYLETWFEALDSLPEDTNYINK